VAELKSNQINQLNIGDPALPASVYGYRNMYTCYSLHVLEKEKAKENEEVACDEVALPVGGKEPEPHGVAEAADQVIKERLRVAAGVAGVRLAKVATPEVAEPMVEEVVDDDDDCRSVVMCNMSTCSGNGTQERAVQDLLCLVDLYLVYLI